MSFRCVILRKKYLMLLGAVLASAAIFAAVQTPAAVTASAAARQLPIYCVERDQKVCSISFDAAWGDGRVRLRRAKAFSVLANEEWRHAQVFYAHTHAMLHPKKTKAVLLPLLYRAIGKKRLYPLIAKGEYDATAKYERLIPDFPKVAKVRDDETHHGNMVMALLK